MSSGRQGSNSPTIGIIILAAGASSRMGMPKQLLLHRGRSFLSHIVEAALASICRPVVVVLGTNAEQLKPELSQLPVQVGENHQWAEVDLLWHQGAKCSKSEPRCSCDRPLRPAVCRSPHY